MALTLATSPALADDAPAADLRLNGGLGVMAEGNSDAGLGLTGLATARYGFVQGGLLGDWGGPIFGGMHQLYAGAAGLGWRPGHLRLDLLGVGGVMLYSYDPCTILCSGPTTDLARWTSPWLGARAGVAYNFGSSRAHFELGVAGLFGASTSSGSDTATYYDESWFSGETSMYHDTHDFPATWHLGGLITAGVTFDFGRASTAP